MLTVLVRPCKVIERPTFYQVLEVLSRFIVLHCTDRKLSQSLAGVAERVFLGHPNFGPML